jgi:hypothetical protein
MDHLVDLAEEPGPVGDRSPTDESGAHGAPSTDPVASDDVESELYCSAREAGWGYAGIGAYGPGPDDGLD